MKPVEKIPISLLYSPKKELDHKRGASSFIEFINELKRTHTPPEAIEVYKMANGKYYIANGVHRAKAAQLAGMLTINAIVYNDSKPMGESYPLINVKAF